MPNSLHKVIFEGNILPEQDPEVVYKNIADLFNWDKKKVNRLFQNAPIVLKSRVCIEEARRYEKAITRAGVKCNIVKMRSKSIRKPEETSGESPDKKLKETSDRTNKPKFNLSKKEFRVPHFLKRFFPVFWCGFSWIKRHLRKTHKIADSLVQTGLILIFTFVLYISILYMAKGFWLLYTSTPMGKYYMEKFTGESVAISNIFQRDLFFFSCEIIFACFIICMGISMICRFFHISRYFYETRGFTEKLFIWGSILTGAVSYYVQYIDTAINHYTMACIVTLIPTLMIFSFCFNLSETILPEMGGIFGKTLYIGNDFFKNSYPKIKRYLSELAERINSGT